MVYNTLKLLFDVMQMNILTKCKNGEDFNRADVKLKLENGLVNSPNRRFIFIINKKE